jgi:hypothetical protein
MAIQHVNRRRDTYYLHELESKTGKPRLYFSTRKVGRLAESIPPGYEIYESPNAKVFLRRVPPRIIEDQEVEMVRDGVRRLAQLDYFAVEARKNSIVVLMPNQDVAGIRKTLGSFPLANRIKIEDWLRTQTTYSPEMRFVLVDKKKRLFQVQRWCYLGSIDDWIPLGSSKTLAALVKKYCKHLGKESFFDLF